ncbi:hypothetical protein [Planktotalea sp.]|uniref:hypothetical protein n=1 Tax=Planktotalea sp. TaxID=2029877 RepID=UPI003D6C24D9
MSQERLCSFAALVCALLCGVLLFAPSIIFWLFNMTPDAGGEIIARRAAMLFAGLAYMAWGVKDLASSRALQILFRGFAISMALLAVLGCVEFLRGSVGVGIAVAIVFEIYFAVSFARLSMRGS